MPTAGPGLDVYVETGAKRTFAGAVDWPGWCRSGRDEEAAIEALAAYEPRYRRAIAGARLGFLAAGPATLRVVERMKGDATTDFGAPSIAPAADGRPVDDAELRRLVALLKACWRTFDAAAGRAEGRDLARGPRGGGRDLEKIVEHVRSAEEGYLMRLGRKVDKADVGPGGELASTRRAVLDGLSGAVRDGVPAAGPRGGARWTVPFFVRRATWHVLDHAWEIEDRTP
jgi:hypothetical protein